MSFVTFNISNVVFNTQYYTVYYETYGSRDRKTVPNQEKLRSDSESEQFFDPETGLT